MVNIIIVINPFRLEVKPQLPVFIVLKSLGPHTQASADSLINFVQKYWIKHNLYAVE
jgi:hypothetical protein